MNALPALYLYAKTSAKNDWIFQKPIAKIYKMSSLLGEFCLALILPTDKHTLWLCVHLLHKQTYSPTPPSPADPNFFLILWCRTLWKCLLFATHGFFQVLIILTIDNGPFKHKAIKNGAVLHRAFFSLSIAPMILKCFYRSVFEQFL